MLTIKPNTFTFTLKIVVVVSVWRTRQRDVEIGTNASAAEQSAGIIQEIVPVMLRQEEQVVSVYLSKTPLRLFLICKMCVVLFFIPFLTLHEHQHQH